MGNELNIEENEHDIAITKHYIYFLHMCYLLLNSDHPDTGSQDLLEPIPWEEMLV